MAEQAKFIGETSPNFRKIVVDGFYGNIDSIGLDVQIYSTQKVNCIQEDSRMRTYSQSVTTKGHR